MNLKDILPLIEAGIAELTSPSLANVKAIVLAGAVALNDSTGGKVPLADLTAFIDDGFKIAEDEGAK